MPIKTNNYVKKTGDTMTDILTIQKTTSPRFTTQGRYGGLRMVDTSTGGRTLVIATDNQARGGLYLFDETTNAAIFQILNGTTAATAGSISKCGYVALASMAKADAPNSSLYYSTTSNRLVWKDAAGNENALY